MKTIRPLLFGILAFTTSLAFRGNAQSVPTNGLVAYYPFNGNANDASGNGNNGFAENTFATVNQFGLTNSALGFTGNSWVFVPYSASLNTTNFSVSLMFNSQIVFNHFCLLRSGAGPATSDFYNGYELSDVDFNSDFGFTDFDGESDYISGQCITPITHWQQNQWYNLTFTQNGTNASFYRDGVLVASATNTKPYIPAQSSPLYIGSNSSGSSDPTAAPFDFVTGSICDIRFYNRGLSAGEVQQLYLHEAGPLLGLQEAVKPSFSNLSLGTNYQLQVSGDLNTWTNQGSVFTATNTTVIYPQYYDVSNFNQLFFRLQVVP